MDTKPLEKFCPWARTTLIEAVDLRCRRFALDPEGLAAMPADADVVAGRVLSPEEKAQRAKLAERIGASGYAAFCGWMAYTWFNRFAAIRYMELHDYLPCHVRMLSAAEDGAFNPDCLRQAADLGLPGLDATCALQLMAASEDEELFRRVIVAQCNELAECLPEVFGQVDAAAALTLPDGLLRQGEHDFLYHLVADIPEESWQDVEVLGWMYQFYNSELKDDFFKSKRKATAADIAPATQLFTPEWIVRYMVENSLGRLWMLNRPDSRLRDRMEYYVEPDAEHEDFVRVESPEDITLCDPACGSGHILSYAFELLFAIYEECGYTAREIPELILTKNLSGYEVDGRAVQIASLVLALRAREHDRRFFRREVRADVHVLASLPFKEGECALPEALAKELTHLGEVGSLLNPTDEDMDALRKALDVCSGDLFANNAAERLGQATESCEALRRRFDVVVANPPYMGSSRFNAFMSKWIKKNYPDVKSDLCTCFIERVMSLAVGDGFSALVTSDTCMYLSSFEALRNKLIDESTLLSLIDTRGTNAHPDVFDANAVWVLQNGHHNGYEGAYFKLNHRIGEKDAALLEAIKNPTCGWFYRRDASTFHQIPGSPIAYWVGNSFLSYCGLKKKMSDYAEVQEGLKTSDNERFIRRWYEVPFEETNLRLPSIETRWVKHSKGGPYRRWYGNQDDVLFFEKNGRVLRGLKSASLTGQHNYGKECISWGRITSDLTSFRYYGPGFIPNMAGLALYPTTEGNSLSLLAFLNSSIVNEFIKVTNPTLNVPPGCVASIPKADMNEDRTAVGSLAQQCVEMSKLDWDSLETSWDFKRSPLL